MSLQRILIDWQCKGIQLGYYDKHALYLFTWLSTFQDRELWAKLAERINGRMFLAEENTT